MEIQCGKYTVKIVQDHDYTPGSADNVREYNRHYFPDPDYTSSLLGIDVYEDDNLLDSALIGTNGQRVYEGAVIVEEERIIFSSADRLYCLSVPQLEPLWTTKADTTYCFEVFRYGADYIVHGELEITRIDHNGNICWQRSGADIFSTPEGINDFVMTDEYILAHDWQHNSYKFDYDGNAIV
ncbi:hypothetical protein [Chitinophaga sp. Cy-1792]|uniref:hypothetical protein n=1 Tax=Chitinophaga sp. Cy-1792 TaxID=2608339 RepID=UPI001423A5FE|nr:hypothetical protein [Chitinophaga sp. Cy-1792]NIG55741.1 hypothetical protein [Chitinophaga sp. Cy-1792]